jgi:hypothetical protein
MFLLIKQLNNQNPNVEKVLKVVMVQQQLMMLLLIKQLNNPNHNVAKV